MHCFALLDDGTSAADDAASRLYTGFVREVRCDDPRTLDAAWAAVETAQRAGLNAVIIADYEWGTRLHGIMPAPVASSAGALRVLLFSRLERLSRDAVNDWLASTEESANPAPAGIANVRASVAREPFCASIDRIHAAIRAGETYQVNYTLRLHFDTFGSAIALYRRMRAAQPVAYSAFIRLPDSEDTEGEDTEYVLSCSPELFLRHQAGRLGARPMKGTAPRSGDAEEDRRIALDLGKDEKNRAENLMIVDLLRNDLGRIADTGSVRVPALFTIEPYPTVFQMTSTVEAALPPDTAFTSVLRALFPCGSITGAPKHRTMQLIAELENEPRGLYTGGIGWIDAPGDARRCGDFCLSVAIRTLTLGPVKAGVRKGRMGVGAGIVIDSDANAEYDESLLKARFLTGFDPGFALIETMRATGASGVPLLDRHLARLAASAAALGFECEVAGLRASISGRCSHLAKGSTSRLRLQLHKDGSHEVGVADLAPLPDGDVKVLLSDPAVDGEDYLLRHKTTHRARYDAAIRTAESRGAFDMLFFNRHGELTEGARSNVFVLVDGQWLTPPCSAGVLPGIMRSVILEDREWGAREARITRSDILAAERVMVCNALRGPLIASLFAGAGCSD